ncbi:hypothetical protein CAPTEDRAFT_180194 [Capitella teleta]|uniref:Uncharacterized protein n=1 Tax=Capitella teleta TaxID=283909 RepID=N1PB17_CAPTE|nr:hypothetical protein CAPTEDRAFT_180194 [Capitella teleta]|eukprot:ELU18883.1 hypothetical protein CAPTEDRAFT_180194 [Capitella teleta]
MATASPNPSPTALSVPSSSLGAVVLTESATNHEYPVHVINDSPNSLVARIVLCYWDNIMGPCVRHLWNSEAQGMHVPQSALDYIATHTLSGEITRDEDDPTIDFRFFLIRESNLIVTSFVFGAIGGNESVVHSLSIVVRQEHRQRCLELQALMSSWMLRGIHHLRVYLEKETGDTSMDRFTPYLMQFIQMLTSLNESGLPGRISDCDIDTAFNPDCGCQFDGHFLCRAISSHLISARCSVVVGDNPNKVNKMIATLGLFLDSAERQCSRFVLYGNKSCPYSPDLFLQGFLQSASGELNTSLKDVHLSQRPTTLIDLTTQEVKFSCQPHQHLALQYRAVKRKLNELWTGRADNTFPFRSIGAKIILESHFYLLPFFSEMFHTFDEPETLVTNLFEEWKLLPPNIKQHEAYISQFISGLDRKAMTLIRFVECETNCGQNPLKISVKKLRQDLSLKVPGDFSIVLATAEKLKPGIFHFVTKGNNIDPAEFLDSF